MRQFLQPSRHKVPLLWFGCVRAISISHREYRCPSTHLAQMAVMEPTEENFKNLCAALTETQQTDRERRAQGTWWSGILLCTQNTASHSHSREVDAKSVCRCESWICACKKGPKYSLNWFQSKAIVAIVRMVLIVSQERHTWRMQVSTEDFYCFCYNCSQWQQFILTCA